MPGNAPPSPPGNPMPPGNPDPGGPPAPTGQAPIAVNDTFTIDEDGLVNGNLITGLGTDGATADSDPNGDELTITAVLLSTGEVVSLDTPTEVDIFDQEGSFIGTATLTVSSNGDVTLDPGSNLLGLDAGDIATLTFTYTLSDRTFTDTADVTVNINGLPNADPPVLVTTALSMFENHTSAGLVEATGANGDTLSFTLTGNGADDALFTITAGGGLSFNAAPDFENPLDMGGVIRNNVYEVQVQVEDGNGVITTGTVQVTVQDLNEVQLGIDAFFGDQGPDHVVLNNGSGTLSDTLPDGTLVPQPTGAELTKDVALGDLDGDGDLDAFVAVGSGTNQVMINDGKDASGAWLGFTEASSSPPGSVRSNGVALGDLNGDSILDAFVANSQFNELDGAFNQVLLGVDNDGDGLGDGTFSETLPDGTLNQPPGEVVSNDAALADFDGDGNLDAFVVNKGANQVLLGKGDGTFTEGPAPPGELNGSGLPINSQDVAVADLDGDGDVDVFVANQNDDNQILLNNGTDGSGAWLGFSEVMDGAPSTASNGVALGDLDGDGDFDAFVATAGNVIPNKVLLNDGSGVFSFASEDPPHLGRVGQDVALADLNGDGVLDAVLANDNRDGGVEDGVTPNQILYGDGDGTFTAGPALTESDLTVGVALGDLDGDGPGPAVDANGLPNLDPSGLLLA